MNNIDKQLGLKNNVKVSTVSFFNADASSLSGIDKELEKVQAEISKLETENSNSYTRINSLGQSIEDLKKKISDCMQLGTNRKRDDCKEPHLAEQTRLGGIRQSLSNSINTNKARILVLKDSLNDLVEKKAKLAGATPEAIKAQLESQTTISQAEIKQQAISKRTKLIVLAAGTIAILGIGAFLLVRANRKK